MAEKRQIVVPFEVVDGEVVKGGVKVVCNISKGRGADKVELFKELEHTFDYTGCKLEDIIDKAATSDVISLQSAWREMSTGALKEEHHGRTKMAEYYSRTITRTAPDPFKQVLKKVETMGEAELTAYIAQLQAIANKGK